MLALVASAADSNAAGVSAYVGFSQPVGIQDGDLVLVCIATPAASVTVAPPSADWILVAPQTDPTQSLGLVAYYTTALNLPSNIVFALSADAGTMATLRPTGVLVAYRGADDFEPVEVSASILTAASATHDVRGVSVAQNEETALLFIAGLDSGTYTPVTGFQLAARKQQTTCTLEAQHRSLQNAGPIAAFTETFSSAVVGASLLIVLTPSPGTLTYQDAYDRIFEMLPPGIDNILDFTPGTGDFWKIVWTIGAMFKTFQFDLLDILRAEVVPFLSRYKLPDWERVFGLLLSRAAQIGTIPQRQQQVVGAWRAAAGQAATLELVQATIGPLLGYNSTTLATIVESDPSALKLMHTYNPATTGDYAIADAGSADVLFYVSNDGGRISEAGVQLEVQFDTGDLDGVTLELYSPNGDVATWAKAWQRTPLRLFAKDDFAGSSMQGFWRLHVANASGAAITLYDGAQLRLDGMGRGKQTGGAIFTWGVLVDWAKIGESGTQADFTAALRAIKKLAQSHTIGGLFQSSEPWPGVEVGVNASIPGQAIPV